MSLVYVKVRGAQALGLRWEKEQVNSGEGPAGHPFLGEGFPSPWPVLPKGDDAKPDISEMHFKVQEKQRQRPTGFFFF